MGFERAKQNVELKVALTPVRFDFGALLDEVFMFSFSIN